MSTIFKEFYSYLMLYVYSRFNNIKELSMFKCRWANFVFNVIP